MTERPDTSWGYAKFVAAVALIALELWGCPQPHASREQLEAEGYTEIRVNSEGWRGYRCLSWHATGFTAKSPIGQRVDGAVCCGMVTACTVKISTVHKEGR